MKEPFYPAVQYNHCVSNKTIAGALLAAAVGWHLVQHQSSGAGSSTGWGQRVAQGGKEGMARGWWHTLPSARQFHGVSGLFLAWVKAPVCGSASWSSLQGRIRAGKSKPCISRQTLALICECSHETQAFILVKFSFWSKLNRLHWQTSAKCCEFI